MEPDRVAAAGAGRGEPAPGEDSPGGEDEGEHQPPRPARGGNPHLFQVPSQRPRHAHIPILRTGQK